MTEFIKSQKLDNVFYDIRGPVQDEAHRMEDEGHHILKLNIGNPAAFGFTAPDEIIQDVIRNLPNAGLQHIQGHLLRPQGGDAVLSAKRHRRGGYRGYLSG